MAVSDTTFGVAKETTVSSALEIDSLSERKFLNLHNKQDDRRSSLAASGASSLHKK